MRVNKLSVLMSSLCLAGAGLIWDGQVRADEPKKTTVIVETEEKKPGIKEGAKEIGEGGKRIGRGTARTSKAVARKTKRVALKVADKTEDAAVVTARSTKKGALVVADKSEDVGEATAKGAKKTAKKVGRWTKKTVKGDGDNLNERR